METLRVPRRRFLKEIGALAGVQLAHASLPFSFPAFGLGSPDQTRADYTLHIKTAPIEIAPTRIISAITYNGQFPGPLLLVREGGRSRSTFTTIRYPGTTHWHGGDSVDGRSCEEHTIYSDWARADRSHQALRTRFITRLTAPVPTWLPDNGRRSRALAPLSLQEPGRYDKEVFLVLRFEPGFSIGGDAALFAPLRE